MKCPDGRIYTTRTHFYTDASVYNQRPERGISWTSAIDEEEKKAIEI